MDKDEIQNLIKELIEKTTIKLNSISVTEEGSKNIWVSLDVGEPMFFTSREGEGLQALNHLVHRIIETKMLPKRNAGTMESNIENTLGNILIDINGFQKKHIEGIRAVAHMMSERARYFKSNIEVDPMSAFERRIVHEFLSEATDLKTESVGFGPSRRVVIKYVGAI
ncbi:MAG: R3H domain-containing nucleic acid-binding protein [Candidatus Pacebacteria bacterium]|nr:R3H domain-containing nucleic acid-binding protein [Candidatus Paceibacterota bacterium]